LLVRKPPGAAIGRLGIKLLKTLEREHLKTHALGEKAKAWVGERGYDPVLEGFVAASLTGFVE